MAYSYTAFTGNGSTTQYAVSFPYIRREHVAVTVAGVPSTFTWVNNSLIQMDAAPAAAAAVRVYRTTPISAPLVDFADGATLVAADLDTNSRQSIYIQQELDDAQTDNLPNVIPNGNKGDITTSVGGTVWAINNGAVTEVKLAANAVTSGKIADGAVAEAEIATGAVTETKLGTGSVTSAKILDGTIVNADVNASAGIAASKLAFTQSGTGATARTVDSKLKDMVSVKDFGAVGDGTTDDTAAINAALAASNHVYFPPGPYAVTSITIGNFKHLSGYPDFKGIASSATIAIVVINGLRCTFEYLAVDQNFNINYTAAIHWHSLSQATPAQYNRIYSLKLDNCQIGILFGQLNGTAVVDAPQSENSITHMITRGCHTPIYMNQPNGFLFISDSTISSIRNEWPAGDYSYATTATAKIFKGVLRISNSELLKTDTQLGDGVAVTGGAVRFSNCTFEIASKNFSTASGGGTLENATELGLHGCKFYMANATGPFVSHSDGILWINSCKVERASGAKASARGFIEYSGSSTRAFIDSVQLYNFLADTLINAGSSPYTFNIPSEFYVNSLHSESTDVSNGLFIPSNTGAISPLIAKGVDLDCNTLDGWFYKLDYGGGSSYSVVASSPTLPLPKKNLVNSIQLVATGSAWVSTLDDTSLSTVKSTGIRCTNRQRFLISCWAKESGGQADIGVVTANSSGVATFTSLLGPLSANWEYFQCLYEAAAGVRYIGISIRGIGTTCNITGASLIPLE